MNAQQRIKFLEEKHEQLNHLIDTMESKGTGADNELTDLKKKRLKIKDNITELKK